jgi:hypothetical protein
MSNEWHLVDNLHNDTVVSKQNKFKDDTERSEHFSIIREKIASWINENCVLKVTIVK